MPVSRLFSGRWRRHLRWPAALSVTGVHLLCSLGLCVALVACGGASSAASTAPATVPDEPLGAAQAARLLTQATYGPTQDDIDRLTGRTARQWLDEQLVTPPMDTHWAYVVERKGPLGCQVCDARYINAAMESFWTQAVQGPDQLRQRMVLALSELFVVSTVNSSVETQAEAHAAYLDMLSRNAFGNFRTLLEEVSTHPTMGHYL